jgi:short-subunit dehydrogenase
MKPTVILFGANGGIGLATKELLLENQYQVIPITKDQINFSDLASDRKVIELLNYTKADIIINAVGVFVDGVNDTHYATMDINVGSNWSIVRYYANLIQFSKPTRIIMVGSSSYREGKQKYMLYSASKAALYNLWQGAKDFFENSSVDIDLINPVRVRTKMTADRFDPNLDYLEPKEVAQEILALITQDQPSRCVDMTFKETI